MTLMKTSLSLFSVIFFSVHNVLYILLSFIHSILLSLLFIKVYLNNNNSNYYYQVLCNYNIIKVN